MRKQNSTTLTKNARKNGNMVAETAAAETAAAETAAAETAAAETAAAETAAAETAAAETAAAETAAAETAAAETAAAETAAAETAAAENPIVLYLQSGENAALVGAIADRVKLAVVDKATADRAVTKLRKTATLPSDALAVFATDATDRVKKARDGEKGLFRTCAFANGCNMVNAALHVVAKDAQSGTLDASVAQRACKLATLLRALGATGGRGIQAWAGMDRTASAAKSGNVKVK